MPEVEVGEVADLRQRNLDVIEGDGAGLDLGQVEDLVDQGQQVLAGAVDDVGELDLLLGQVLFRVLGQLLGQDEKAVERRSQLVRHVGHELALVLGGDLQLLGLLLQ